MSSRADEETPLGVLKRILDPTERDQFLKQANLGLGNYDKSLYYQQVESFRNHLLGEALFGDGQNIRRAISDVQYMLALEEWADLSPEERDEALRLDDDDPRREGAREKKSRREWFREKGSEKWEDLVEAGVEAIDNRNAQEMTRIENKLRVLEDRAGVDGEFVDPFGRMILARHEGSRSIKAHLIDSVTGRVKELKGDGHKKKRGIRNRK
jgi:hypothetical protein